MNSLQVYAVVDEMFLAGEIRETSQTKVLKQLLMLTSLEWPTTRHFAWSHWCNSEGLFKECGWTFLSVKWLLLNLHIWVTHFGCEKFLRQIVRRRYYCDAPSVKVADFKSDCFHFEFGRFCLWEAAFLRWFIGLFSGFFLEYMDCSKETWCFQPLKCYGEHINEVKKVGLLRFFCEYNNSWYNDIIFRHTTFCTPFIRRSHSYSFVFGPSYRKLSVLKFLLAFLSL